MNIIHIIPSLGKGGAESLVLNICNEITKNTKHKVKLIVFRAINKLEDHFKEIDIDLVPYKYNLYNDKKVLGSYNMFKSIFLNLNSSYKYKVNLMLNSLVNNKKLKSLLEAE